MDDVGETVWPAGWYPDPVQRFEFRWFNGQRWTADVSADGLRFIDDGSIVPRPSGSGRGTAEAERPSRTLAILALIFGSGGLLIAWVPFLFVVGGAGAIAAIVLGIIALRHVKRGRAVGRGMAIGGIAAAVAALGLCSVGVIFTQAIVDDLEDFVDPGPHEVEITACTADSRGFAVEGTIRNLDDVIHDYVIVVEVDNGETIRTRPRIAVADVPVGDTQSWDVASSARGFDVGDLRCELIDVNGPNPFEVADN